MVFLTIVYVHISDKSRIFALSNKEIKYRINQILNNKSKRYEYGYDNNSL